MLKSRPSRRLRSLWAVALLWCALLPSGSLFAQTSALVSTNSITTKPKLRWMGRWANDPWKKQFEQEMARAFAFRHPEIEVELVYPEGMSEKKCATLITNMIETGNCSWDIVWASPRIDSRVSKTLRDHSWEKKHLVDFYEIEGFRQTQLPFAIETVSHPLTGPCVEGRFFVTWYNQPLAKKLGLSIEGTTLTHTDLLHHARRVNEYNRTAKEPIATILDFQRASSSRRLFRCLLISKAINPDGTLPKALSGGKRDSILRETLEVFEQLAAYKAIHPRHTEILRRPNLHLMYNSLFLFDTTSAFDRLQESKSSPLKGLRLLHPSVFRAGNYALGEYSSSWAVMKQSPEQSWGIELMKFWSRPEVAEGWVRNTRSPTGLSGNIYSPNYSEDALGRFQDSMSRQRPEAIYFSQDIVSKYWGRAAFSGGDVPLKIQSVLAGRISAARFYEEFSGKMESNEAQPAAP